MSTGQSLLDTLHPEIFCISPPLLDFKDELVWINIAEYQRQKVSYDKYSSINAHSIQLIQQAFTQPLSLQDQQIILDELTKHPHFIELIGLTPDKLPQLIENNPLISIEILASMINSIKITEYYDILVHMDITLHSLEVVNRLTTLAELPSEFIHLYISNCISKCETVKEKYMQSRLVRLVCVFLQSLIRNKIINVKELFIEIEAFCVGFSRIKEAVGLYRLLRQLEFGETGQTVVTLLSKDDKPKIEQ